MQSFCEFCFQAPMDCRCIMNETMECGPAPRGGYRDRGVAVKNEDRPMLQPNYAAETVLTAPPRRLAAMAERHNRRWHKYILLHIQAWNSKNGRRSKYWWYEAERSLVRFRKLVEKFPQYRWGFSL